MIDQLKIKLLYRPGTRFPGGGYRTERFSVDFVVNGRSLYEWLRPQDMCGTFLSKRDQLKGREQINAEQQRLFTSAETRPSRLSIFVCPECGDLGCGAMRFDLAREQGTFVWSRFGFENGYDETASDFESYAEIGPFKFDADHYVRVIALAAEGEV